MEKEYPLHRAVKNKQFAQVSKLLRETADVDEKNEGGRTPLYVAVNSKSEKSLDVLLKAGANVNLSEAIFGFTPLHLATVTKNLSMMKTLIHAGADINPRDKLGRTPLVVSIETKKTKVMKLLIDHGANLNIRCHKYITPLINCIQRNNVNLATLLIDSGADVNLVASNNDTPLHSAVKNQTLEILKLLLNAGANPDAMDRNFYLPAQFAVVIGDTVALKVLIAAKGDPTEWLVYVIKDMERTMKLTGNGEDMEKSLRTMIEYCDVNRKDESGDNKLVSVMEAIDNGTLPPQLEEFLIIFCNVLSEYVAKLEVLRYPVDARITQFLVDKDIYHLEDCREEAIRATRTRLHNCWVTFFDLLVNERRFMRSAGSQSSPKDLKIIKDKFPIYGAEMRRNMTRGIGYRKLYEKSEIALRNNLPELRGTGSIIRSILDHMDYEDWKILSQGELKRKI